VREAKVDMKDSDGWTALHNAASQGHLRIVKYLLLHTPAEVDIKSNKGHTPLSKSCKIDIAF
jgi:ankyrin repeat protein